MAKTTFYLVFGTKADGVEAMKLLKAMYPEGEFAFCDNYKRGEIEEIPIFDFKHLCMLNARPDSEIHLFIAAGRFMEIYEQCTIAGIAVDGIYDPHAQQFYSYKDYCQNHFYTYRNEKFIRFIYRREKEIQKGESDFLSGKPLSKCISRVSLMLSNLCNYASIHPQCPASLIKEKQVMSRKDIVKVVKELKLIQFSGTISFHVYNEPLIDPRLFDLAKYVKSELPGCTIFSFSNGYYLNQTLLDELADDVMDALTVTAYGKSEFERISKLDAKIAFQVFLANLDGRLNWYEAANKPVSNKKCRTFLNQINVFPNGDIGLCCLDHRHNYEIGNLFSAEEGLLNCIDSIRIRSIQEQLLHGDRNRFDLCKNCTWEL